MPRGFGPLLSFQVSPDSVSPDSVSQDSVSQDSVSQDSAAAADKVVASSALILPATSFGGVESTWERRARWPAETAPAGLIRLSVGVEPAGDLITDIDQALEVL
jgi:cystathionine beta-lyase/cystathionine gamma-synthase